VSHNFSHEQSSPHIIWGLFGLGATAQTAIVNAPATMIAAIRAKTIQHCPDEILPIMSQAHPKEVVRIEKRNVIAFCRFLLQARIAFGI
jgi:hypothetical protein